MPELPEVETIKNELAPHVIGHRIRDIDLHWEGIVKKPSAAEFRRRLCGKTVTGIERRGKYFIFRLDSDDTLVIHLKMSGALLLNPYDNRFIRATLRFNDVTVYFRDPRKFGAMWLVKDENEAIPKLGPDPFEPGFTVEWLRERLHGRKTPVKALLCDQAFIAGVGNMYADEALFAAKIHPMRTGDSLTIPEIKRLYDAVKHVLKAGIGDKGASIQNYYRPSGETGTAHFQFKVAHRRGEKCPVCGAPLQRIVVRGRGTYFCPKCQVGLSLRDHPA